MAIQRASLHRLSDLLAFSISFSLRRVQALDEEMDDVKHMNQMMLYSKIVTIRDAQIQEKRSASGAIADRASKKEVGFRPAVLHIAQSWDGVVEATAHESPHSRKHGVSASGRGLKFSLSRTYVFWKVQSRF